MTTEFVLNQKSSSPDVVHRATCPTIQHHVHREIREELPEGGFRVVNQFPDGTALVAPNEGHSTWYYEPVYVTAEDMATHRRRYRRCGVCSPDIPDGPGPSNEQRVRVGSLRRHHLGREFRTVGPLREFRCTENGWTLIGEFGTVTLGDDEVTAYVKDEPGVSNED